VLQKCDNSSEAKQFQKNVPIQKDQFLINDPSFAEKRSLPVWRRGLRAALP